MDLQDMPVTLVIKAPNQRMEDLTVDCMLGWTIRKLKQHLETVYPSKPKENEQRLIYSGKLLQDHLTLKEVLHQDEENSSNKHTVHLVCSSSKVSTTSSSQNAKDGAADQSPQSSTTPSSSPASASTIPGANTSSTSPGWAPAQDDGLRFRGHASNVPPSTESYFPNQMPAYSQATAGYPYSPEQYAWMMQQQQFYSQYMMQYMQYYQGMYGGAGVMPSPPFGMPPATSATTSPFPQTMLPQQQQPPQLQPQQQQQQQQQQQANQGPQQPQQQGAGGNNNNGPRQNMRMNAQGGMEEDDEDEADPRDWLHHTYFLMRLLTFLGILFFYSNLSRFLMVFAGSFAIYFFQKLRKYMQRIQREREQQQEQQQQQQQEEQQPAPPQENGEQAAPPQEPLPEPAAERPNADTEQAQENPAAAEEPAAENQTAQEVQEEGNRLMKLFLFISRTIQIFFTSLVPAPAELLEAN